MLGRGRSALILAPIRREERHSQDSKHRGPRFTSRPILFRGMLRRPKFVDVRSQSDKTPIGVESGSKEDFLRTALARWLRGGPFLEQKGEAANNLHHATSTSIKFLDRLFNVF